MNDVPADFTMQRSSRDEAAMAAALTPWIASHLPDGADPKVVLSGASDANGMSSETILADISWTEDGRHREGSYVMRMAPAQSDVPVFREYRMDHQHEAIRLVGELTDVPVPAVHWLEPTGEVLGQPFFFMERLEGIVPPDVMPYTFGDNWFFDADPADQRRLQDSTVKAIAGIHGISDPATRFAFLDADGTPGDTPLRRHVARTRAWYEWAAAEIGDSQIVPRALDWLEANWPDSDTPDNVVLSWGDSRIGNCLYRDFEPVAVLDWEMAGLGPRELDLGWIVFAHQVFQSISSAFELPGLPDVLRAEDVRATYAELTGVEAGDLRWYEIYSGVLWGIVFMRTGARQVHFGEIEKPGTPDELMHHSPLLTRLLDEVTA
ncbi:phosphotransferase family protein [Marmoricola sp. RAF53]|uniref:phosphotransferase family protein n=1 Tax=Marmoricola sp. RAF53 TaxID=3233059 RepID=UPI003F98AA05